MRKAILFATMFLLVMNAVACGIKPSEVAAPAEVEQDNFPKTYPDIETDPN